MLHECFLGAHTGLRVSNLALGTARIGTAPDRELDPKELHATLHAFAEAGGTLVDTSSKYLGGRSEELLGSFFADAGRERFVVSTKFGVTHQEAPPAASVGNSRGAMQREVENSLRRLRTDRIDVYFAHFDDGATPVEEVLRGLEDLTRAGKIVHAGLSNFPAWKVATALTLGHERHWTHVAVQQLQYSLLDRAIEREHLPLAAAHGLATMAYSPLAGGKLARVGRGDGTLANALLDVAAECETSAAVVALAWVRQRGHIPVLGPRTRAHLVEQLAAGSLELDVTQRERLDAASAPVLGYPYDLLAQVQKALVACR